MHVLYIHVCHCIIVVFLLIVALAVRDPNMRVPYRHLKPENVVGLPPGIRLVHPSQMKQEHLQMLYDNMDAVKFVGMVFSTLC